DFTDNKGGAIGSLVVQEFGGSNGGSEDAFFVNVEPGLLQAVCQIAGGVLGVVGQNGKFSFFCFQALNKLISARNHLGSVHQNAIHINQKVLLHNFSFRFSPSQ